MIWRALCDYTITVKDWPIHGGPYKPGDRGPLKCRAGRKFRSPRNDMFCLISIPNLRAGMLPNRELAAIRQYALEFPPQLEEA